MNFRSLFSLVVVLLLPACASIEYTLDKAPRMLVLHDEIPFFLHGPAQGNGADRTLKKGDEVLVLRKEFGYSFVQLSDGQKGYLANEELVVSPPVQNSTNSMANTQSSSLVIEKWTPSLPAAPEKTNAPALSSFAPPEFRY